MSLAEGLQSAGFEIHVDPQTKTYTLHRAGVHEGTMQFGDKITLVAPSDHHTRQFALLSAWHYQQENPGENLAKRLLKALESVDQGPSVDLEDSFLEVAANIDETSAETLYFFAPLDLPESEFAAFPIDPSSSVPPVPLSMNHPIFVFLYADQSHLPLVVQGAPLGVDVKPLEGDLAGAIGTEFADVPGTPFQEVSIEPQFQPSPLHPQQLPSQPSPQRLPPQPQQVPQQLQLQQMPPQLPPEQPRMQFESLQPGVPINKSSQPVAIMREVPITREMSATFCSLTASKSFITCL